MLKIDIVKKSIVSFVFLVILILTFSNVSYALEDVIMEQSEKMGITNYIQDANNYINDNFDIDIRQTFSSLISGQTGDVKNSLLNKILEVLGGEFKSSIILIGKILVIVFIASMLTHLSNSFGSSSGVSEIGFFIAYITIIILVMSTFNNMLGIASDAIEKMSAFMYSSVPIFFTLILATGSITTASIFEPILLGATSVISVLVNTIVMPAILIYTVLNIVSNLSEKEQLKKLSDFVKSATLWILGLSLTITIGIISLEGSLSSTIDGMTAKTAKTAMSTFIPVVGKTLGDAIDTIMGSTLILKNAVGMLGVIILLAIGLIPIVKVSILMGLYYLSSAIIEPISDSRIVKCMGYIGDSLKLILAILITITFIYIIAITLLIKITNFTFTYR